MKTTKPSFPTKGCGIRGAKKARHQRKGSGTAGRDKVSTCKANWMQRGTCRVSRSYKWSTFGATMNKLDRENTTSATARARVVAFNQGK